MLYQVLPNDTQHKGIARGMVYHPARCGSHNKGKPGCVESLQPQAQTSPSGKNVASFRTHSLEKKTYLYVLVVGSGQIISQETALSHLDRQP